MRKGILIILLLLSGCGFFGSPDKPADLPRARPRAHVPAIQNETTPVSIDTVETAGNNSLIEILWTIPSEPVDGFVIHYGEYRDSLNQEIRVSRDSLERLEGPDNRPLFRYVMGDVPKNKPIFIAIASYRDNVTSPPSAAYEVQPQQ